MRRFTVAAAIIPKYSLPFRRPAYLAPVHGYEYMVYPRFGTPFPYCSKCEPDFQYDKSHNKNKVNKKER